MDNAYGIQLRQPLPGDLIGNRLTVAAIGTAFEASYGWKLTFIDATIAEGSFQAGSMGLMESFVHEEPLTLYGAGEVVFGLFGEDPSGQHHPGLHHVQVPVVLIPGMRGYVVHQVVSGDTLSEIALRHGSTVEHIATANGIRDPDLIRVGQVLRVPVPGHG